MYRFEVTALASSIPQTSELTVSARTHSTGPTSTSMSKSLSQGFNPTTCMHRISPGFIEKHDHESCAAECAMYPTKKHSFMATRWPLDKTLKTQQTTVQHTGVMMPGRSPCGTRRHTAITEDGISPTCTSSAPPGRRPLFSHHSSDPGLPLELSVALRVPVLRISRLRCRLNLRE